MKFPTAALSIIALFVLSGCPCLSVFASEVVELRPGLNRVNVLMVTDDVEQFTASFDIDSGDPNGIYMLDATAPTGELGRSEGASPSLSIEADNCGDGCLFPVGIMVPEGLTAPAFLQISASARGCDGGEIALSPQTL